MSIRASRFRSVASYVASVFHPKLITVVRERYTVHSFVKDLTAGIIVAFVALPLAIAFAIASGVKPEQGIYTAIVAGFAAAVLGGSRTQVTGPTGAFIVIIYGVVQQYGYEGLAIATLIAGVLLVLMGLAKMGVLLKFIPYPVTVGFTSGIALIIFSSQIRDILGLNIDAVPAHFVEQWTLYGRTILSIDPVTAIVGLGSLAIIVLWSHVTHRVPGSLVAIFLMTAIVHIFNVPVATIASRFGEVPNHLPSPEFRSLDWALVTKMFSPAVTIALLAALESLLSAVVADGMQGTRHRPNTELIAQGIANILSPVFMGIPATGAIARTATNIKNGGRTPIAAIIHSVVLLLIMLSLGPWAALIPMPTLAAILIYVAYNMSEWHAFIKLLKSPRGDVAVLMLTFLLTVLIDLTVAIQVGVVLAAFLFLKRMSDVTQVGLITKELKSEETDEDGEDSLSLDRRKVPEGVEVFEIQGSLFFGAIEQFKDAVRQVESPPRVLIVRMRFVFAIDASGIRVLEELLADSWRKGTKVILSGVHAQPMVALERAGILMQVGEINLAGNIDLALRRAEDILKEQHQQSTAKV